MESDCEIFKNSIKYLHSISNIPSLNIPALRSFYLTKGRLMELRSASYLPSNVTKTSIRCQRCFLNLIDGPASYRVKAQKKRSGFAKKLLNKKTQEKPMTKYQIKYLKRLDIFSGNQLAIMCKFCKKESLINLEKPKKIFVSNTITQKKKKKSKKKDKFCGLKQEAVLSLTPQNVKNLHNVEIVPQDADAKKKSKFKLNQKQMEKRNNKILPITKENIRKKEKNIKKKSKLTEFLNSSVTKSNPTSTLKQFLQSL